MYAIFIFIKLLDCLSGTILLYNGKGDEEYQMLTTKASELSHPITVHDSNLTISIANSMASGRIGWFLAFYLLAYNLKTPSPSLYEI